MDLSLLNKRQREAVKSIDSPLLVLAGAGSGKTRVITHKVAYLIEVCGLKPANIAAVTFTNKAAREMKSRIGQLLDSSKTRGLRVSTFHTLGLNILRKEGWRVGLRPGFSILDSQDVAALLRDLWQAELVADSDQLKMLQWKISSYKNAFQDPAQARSLAEDKFDEMAASLYEKYQKTLRAYNAVDFDDLIFLPVVLFRQFPDVLQGWQGKIRYLLVDEYQDTNNCQYELVKQLVGGRNGLTVVGDDDQSIYAWRGAQPENLALLQQDYPNLKLVKLEQNYRSMGRILKAANQLIENNPHVFEKKLWSEMGYGDPIKVMQCRNDEHEAERVVSEILSHRFKHRTKYSDYAILYRSNHQSRVVEKALREHRIPYFLSGGQSFFEKTEVKDIMAYLRLMANHDDDTAFLRVVNTPRREIGTATLEKLGEYALQRNCSLFAACQEMGLAQTLSPRAHEKLSRFTHWVRDIAHRTTQGNFVQTIRDMLKELDYETWLLDSSKDPNAAEKRMENVRELVGWIERTYDQADQESDLADIVSYMTLMNILDRQDDDENVADSVTLMTLHAAKGLEFPHVFIIGMEEEILPHRTSMDEGNIEEERRLAYVGLTRAQKTLTLSCSRIRKRYGERIECEISRFIDELPQDDLVWEGGKQSSSLEEQKQRGQAHLANLKDLLAGS